jgi:hypothetical protein
MDTKKQSSNPIISSKQPRSSIEQPRSSIEQPQSSIEQPRSSIEQSQSSIEQSQSSGVSLSTYFTEKKLNERKIGNASFCELLLAFVFSGEKLSEDTLINKFVIPHLGNIFNDIFEFYTFIKDSSEYFTMFASFFEVPTNFIKIFNKKNVELANKQSNFTLIQANSTILSVAIYQRLFSIMKEFYGSYDVVTRKYIYNTDVQTWTIEKFIELTKCSSEHYDKAEIFITYVNSILNINGDGNGQTIFDYVKAAYFAAATQKNEVFKEQQDTKTQEIRAETVKTVLVPNLTRFQSTQTIFRRVVKKTTDNDGFTLVQEE